MEGGVRGFVSTGGGGGEGGEGGSAGAGAALLVLLLLLLVAVFEEVGEFAAEEEGQDVEEDAGEGEDVAGFWRRGGEVAEDGGAERGTMRSR